MDTFDDFFNGQTFKKKVAMFCTRSGWKIELLDEENALISGMAPSGRRKFCFLARVGKDAVEMFVPTLAQVEVGEGFRGDLANLLLRKNRTRSFAFWCIVDLFDDKESIALMHNTRLSALDHEEFDFVIRKLFEECDALDSAMENFVRTWSRNL